MKPTTQFRFAVALLIISIEEKTEMFFICEGHPLQNYKLKQNPERNN